MQRMDSNGIIALNEPTPAFMNFKQTFDGLRDQGFGNAAPFRMLHEYMGELQSRTFSISNSSSSSFMLKDFQDLQFASNGAFGSSLRNTKINRIRMKASGGGGGGDGKSPIFDIASEKLDGTPVEKLGDLIEGKKAGSIINVASK